MDKRQEQTSLSNASKTNQEVFFKEQAFLEKEKSQGVLSQDFTFVMQEYDRAIERLTSSHGLLLDQVKNLKQEIEYKNRLLAQQERLAALGEMAAGVAHEIRNPLGGMSLYLEMLQKDLVGQPDPSALCAKIQGALKRLNSIVKTILDFTRPLEVQIATLQAQPFITEVVEFTKEYRNEKELEVLTDLSQGPESFQADASLLHQLLLNLLRNALEASPKKGKVWIKLSQVKLKPQDKEGVPAASQETSEWLCFEVLDQGPGISEAIMEKLFTPFHTTKKGGVGLGLALCSRIAQAHGGMLQAYNLSESGACFKLLLPFDSLSASS